MSNKKKQQFLRMQGYNVPIDGSWGPWQESLYQKAITHEKQYPNSLGGTMSRYMDKLFGETTYKKEPSFVTGVDGEIKPETRSPFMVKLSSQAKDNRTPVGYVAQTVVPTAVLGGMLAGGSALTSAGGLKTFVPAVKYIPATLLGGKAVDKATEKATGKTFTEHANEITGTSLGDVYNPGYYAGIPLSKYGQFVGNNLMNRGRYTLEYLMPAGYGNHTKELLNLAIKPFYEKPPVFFNNRKPQWYDRYVKNYRERSAENRFQNGAKWAGISEEEIPTPMYVRNADGSYRMTQEGLWTKPNGDLYKDVADIEGPFPDYFTVGGVGGEHSEYKLKEKLPYMKIMEFYDEQKLNPQWQIADKIKNKFNIDDKSKLGKFIDNNFGSKPLDFILGYKPFTIKQAYGVALDNAGNPIGARPIYRDPDLVYKQLNIKK